MGYYSSEEYFTSYGNDFGGGALPNANTFTTEAATIDSTGKIVSIYQNGTQTATTTLGQAVGAITPGLTVGGTFNSASNGWQGDIQEVLSYDHQLSTVEMNQVNLYISNKYGLYSPQQTGIWYNSAPYNAAGVQAEIIRNHWNKQQANTYIALQSNTSGIDTLGLIDWFQASAVNGLAANGTPNTLPNNGASVSSWTDCAFGNNITQSVSGNQPTFVSGESNSQAGVHFTGNQWLYNANSLGAGLNQDITLITVADTSNLAANQFPYSIGQPSTTHARSLGYYAGEEYFTSYNDDFGSGPLPNANTFTDARP